jgi:hypothetical protein
MMELPSTTTLAVANKLSVVLMQITIQMKNSWFAITSMI